jgi:hypothetical protein
MSELINSLSDAGLDEAIDKINAERSRKRIVAFSAIALALLLVAVATYMSYS